ncbi:HD domain-containing protein [Pontimicrobium aquaticum]|uniref:HD domain-containing protein n=1 Tax=Pontimicrobium aquaticum TaxID=2565367 RepID=A0A4U0ESE8_9FLAO|nr:HD domain-containing protein [Pontimicrobium aquaticum]TJY34695.1 HD domain-containing protein [Pontimicrobium aquaticum]
MTNNNLIEATKNYVRATLKDAEGGHDWFHTLRVFNNSLLISKGENVNSLVVALGALLHDIADSKFHDGDDTIGPKMAREFLFKYNVDSLVIEHVINIIENISFNKSLEKCEKFTSPELDVVQDADRLDAIGAIGIARCFNYGGFKNRKLFDPSIKPNMNMTKEEYKKSTAPTINHFYEKLLLLSDKMNTKTGKRIAKQRHQFMELYLDQFYAEWDGKK